MLKYANYLLLFCIMLCSCHKEQVQKVASRAGAVVYKNVLYGTDTSQQVMDVYLPPGSDKAITPVVILIHGGAWYSGNKDAYDGLDIYSFFNANNYAVVNINYRLSVNYPYPSALNDIDAVIKYLATKRNQWNINSNNICLLGRSSGAHLALMYGYTRNAHQKVKAVIDFYGPTNLTDIAIINGQLGKDVTTMLGAYSDNAHLWHDASPINFVHNAVPTIIYHGSLDSLIPATQSQKLYDSLQVHGVPSILHYSPNTAHGWPDSTWRATQLTTIKWLNFFMKD